MLHRLAALTSVLLVASPLHPPPAEACGIKLTATTPAPRRPARVGAPGSVLMLGKPDRSLERQLVSAGHSVETAPDVASAKQKSYNVIVADAATADQAREAFGPGAVIVRSGDSGDDARQVAARASRKPVRATDRAVVGARVREPIAVGPTPMAVVAARTPEPEPAPAPAPAPDPSPTPTPTPPPARVTAVERGATTETPKPAAPRSFAEVEFHFGTAKAGVTAGMKQKLDRTARWLEANADARLVIEGHADPRGNPDSNMVLSRQRAEAVRDYLISVGGDSSRMEVEAFGDTQLKYGAHDGRNRRVLLKKQ
jgi:outer membrane protein OmpA-like peptidoglycan-associated protein